MIWAVALFLVAATPAVPEERGDRAHAPATSEPVRKVLLSRLNQQVPTLTRQMHQAAFTGVALGTPQRWPWHVAGGAAWSLERVRADPPPGAKGALVVSSRVAAGMAAGMGGLLMARGSGGSTPAQVRTYGLLLVPVLALPALYAGVAVLQRAQQAWVLARQLVPPLDGDPRE